MHRLPLFIFLAAVASSCQKEIDLRLDPYTPNHSIQCLLEPDSFPVLFLSRTVPFFTPDQTPSRLFVHGAEVIIMTGGVADTLKADSVYNWFWCRWEPYYRGHLPVERDREYHLQVRIDNRTFHASTSTDLDPVTVDSVYYTSNYNDIYGGHEGVIAEFKDLAGQPNAYRFEMARGLTAESETVDDLEHRSVCLGPLDTFHIREVARFVYVDDNADGQPVQMVVEPAYTHKKDERIVVRIQTLSTEAAWFLRALDKQRESNLNPFIEPVPLLSFIEGATGYFGAMAVSNGVTFIMPEGSQ